MQDDNKRPRYRKLYTDMIRDKYPEKMSVCNTLLQKENWTALDVIHISQLLFGEDKDRKGIASDQKHRSYDLKSIREILDCQVENKLNNKQIANKYRLSRNSVSKWKKLFREQYEEKNV